MKKLTVILLSTTLAMSSFALSGCAVTTAGIKKGDERNFVRSLNDVSAGRAIKARMTRAPDVDLGEVDVEVAQGVVLLSGNVPDPKYRIEAERIAWSAPNVSEVGNEIQIKSSQGFVRNTKDGILNKAVKTRLIAEGEVKARNFNVETHDGIVYLLGIARTPEELARAAEIASTTRGAREVISYARVVDGATPKSYPQYQAPSQAMPSVEYSAPLAMPQTAPQPQYRSLPQALSTSPVPAPDVSGQFPSDEELGRYRVGTPGEAVSTIESAPYYIDPETGKQIPVSFLRDWPK